MAGGWLAPLIMFWLYVWGPLRPFDYPQGALGPSLAMSAAAVALCLAPSWLPASYYRIQRFERSGRFYEVLGIRIFRSVVPDGDFANRWRRRTEPRFRMIANRRDAATFVARTEASERGHLVLLLFGAWSSGIAWSIGWRGWALYLAAGNVLVNVYPILLQRYTRSRLARVAARRIMPSILNN